MVKFVKTDIRKRCLKVYFKQNYVRIIILIIIILNYKYAVVS